MSPHASVRTALVGLVLVAPLTLTAPAQAQEAAPQQTTQQAPRTLGERAVEEAARHQGKPYRYGATGPSAFDCSGFVQYVFRQVGRELPRTSRAQYAASQKVAKADRRPGDLIAVTDRRGRVTHVGIYAGDDRFWVAPSRGKRVQLQRIYTSRYAVGRFS